MRSVILAISLAIGANVLAETPNLDAPPEPSTLKNIFNRINLVGWEGDPRVWTVKEGFIRGALTPENPISSNTFLIWQDGIIKDFELRLRFRTEATGTSSSGIQYRSKHFPDPTGKNRWIVRGYQYEVRNETILPNVAGFLYDEGGKRGRMGLVGESASMEKNGKKIVNATFLDAEGFKTLIKPSEWNEAIIIAKGNNLKHYLNGKLVLNFTDNNPALAATEGLLALQLTAGKSMWVEFKDIRLGEIKAEEKVDGNKKVSATLK